MPITETLTSHPPCDPNVVWKQLHSLSGINLVHDKIDMDGFHEYLRKASYPSSYKKSFHELFIEKALEHYVSIKLTGFSKDDILVDIAASSSPFYQIVNSLFGCTSYCQDLIFPPGINGFKVGGNATELPFPDQLITRMTLHCSIEHFEKNQDMEFIVEGIKKLAVGGKICIIPLYLREVFYNNTDPDLPINEVEFDEGAKILHTPGWNNRFGRNYDVEQFKKRLLRFCENSDVTIYRFDNAKDAHERCYLTFALIIEKKSA